MTPQQKLSEELCKQFLSILKRIDSLEEKFKIIEMKVNMIALQIGLIDYCDCYPEPTDKVVLEGMPCCPICEKAIKKFIILSGAQK